jgi:hypothetical protein
LLRDRSNPEDLKGAQRVALGIYEQLGKSTKVFWINIEPRRQGLKM